MKKSNFLIWLLIIIFSLLYSSYSVFKHLKVETFIFDLGYYDQQLWLASRFKPIFSSIIWAHPWTDHFSPTLFLLTPLYWIWSSPLILLIFQSLFICIGAYPIYLLAVKKTKSKFFSLSLSFCYLAFYGIQNAIAFDFHAVSLAPTLVAFLFWLYEEKKFKYFWISLLLLIGLQENLIILTFALGIFFGIVYKDIKRSLIIELLALVALLNYYFFINQHFAQGNYYYLHLIPDYHNFTEVFRSLYYPNSKIAVMIYPLLAFGFLPFLSFPIFIVLAEEFLGRFLLTSNPNWWSLRFHYNAILAPIMAWGAIWTVNKYFQNRTKIAVMFMLIGTIVSILVIKPHTLKIFSPSYYDLSIRSQVINILREIPDNASVAATNDLGAQISNREKLFFLANCSENPSDYGSDGRRCYPEKPDYIFANLDPNKWNNYYPDYDRQSLIRYFDILENEGEYGLIKNEGWIYLYKRSF